MLFAILSAGLWILVQYDEFLAKIPSYQQFFTLQNAFLLWVTFVVTKVLHEFGHGFACKHYKGECHSMGVLLLLFTPCFYCDVTDSWMLKNKWQRMTIAAAGMYVELFLASIATFLWWNSSPGLFHHLCFSVMLISSVSTVIFNINPLLRYDGYYIMSDWLEIPNLRTKSSRLFSESLRKVFLQREPKSSAEPRIELVSLLVVCILF